jgi:hypothetical protein
VPCCGAVSVQVGRLIQGSFRLMGESLRFPLPGAYALGLNPAFNNYKVSSHLHTPAETPLH